jgi:hypothetical protein
MMPLFDLFAWLVTDLISLMVAYPVKMSAFLQACLIYLVAPSGIVSRVANMNAMIVLEERTISYWALALTSVVISPW